MTELVECNTQLHKTLQGLWSDALTQHKLQQHIRILAPLRWNIVLIELNVISPMPVSLMQQCSNTKTYHFFQFCHPCSILIWLPTVTTVKILNVWI